MKRLFYVLAVLLIFASFKSCLGVPSEVTPCTNVVGLSYPPQDKAFVARGYSFIFFLSATGNIAYVSSMTGASENWTSPVWVVVDAGATGNGFIFDVVHHNETYLSNGTLSNGGYVHLAYLWYGQTESNRVFYKRGNISSDGLISWNNYQVVLTYSGGSSYWQYPSIGLDSDGRVYISACRASWIPAYSNMTITRNANLNATWTTDSGYPLQPQTYATATGTPSNILGLDNKRMYFAWANLSANTKIIGQWYNGSTWSSVEYCIPNNVMTASDRWGLTRDSREDVITCYIGSTGTAFSSRRQNSTGAWLVYDWTRDGITAASSATSGGEIAWRTDGDDLYYVDIQTPTIRYFVCNGSTLAWNKTANTFDTESGAFGGTGEQRYHALFPTTGSNGTYLILGHAYINGTGGEYLKFHWLTFTPSVIPTPSVVTTDDTGFFIGAGFLFGIVFFVIAIALVIEKKR